jgi:hypothetical protein
MERCSIGCMPSCRHPFRNIFAGGQKGMPASCRSVGAMSAAMPSVPQAPLFRKALGASLRPQAEGFSRRFRTESHTFAAIGHPASL